MVRIVQLDARHEDVFKGEIARHIPYHRMNGKQYCLPALTLYASDQAAELAEASEAVDRIYWKALRFAQRDLPDSFLVQQLGLHPALLSAARIEVPYHGVSRQDWIVNGERGIKCIENNTDTPTGIPETAYLAAKLIGDYTDFAAASSGMRSTIQTAFDRLLRHYAEQGLEGPVVFSSYGWHLEDRTNTEYLMEAVHELGYDTLYVPLEELEIVPGDGLYAGGRRIAVLYRLYPLEYLVHDTDEQGTEPIGEALLELVVQGRLGLINPAQSIITQSKGFMALIWSLYERRDQTEAFIGRTLFDPEDIAAIERYLLPTYYEPSLFTQSETPFVAKGYWGREGKGTSLFDGEGRMVEEEWGHDESELADIQDYYDRQPKVYQQLFPLQALQVETEEGEFDGYLLTGAYVIGGCYAGLLPRIGGKITGDMAYYCPAAITYP
ncbi:glutathionylspermidine synthase family protein [Paenibacillus silvisoli]|uniref:glutathionylspermidine synthase family protein n=1 Tax=Paenibacillus silvisoli TaxID=3110539 RepID=UPI002803C98C|nr:glutathionylspermidine synthase family protein [Paenibacillus silvisoli]